MGFNIKLEDEKKARDDLLNDIKRGDTVIIVKGRHKGTRGIVCQISDYGNHDMAEITAASDVSLNDWAQEALRPTSVRVAHILKVWPGIRPDQHPIGGWAKLREAQEACKPRPVLGQLVRSFCKTPQGNATKLIGRVTHIEFGVIGWTTEWEGPQPTIWTDPCELQVAQNGRWLNYTEDILAKPATPIAELPEPFCQIRKLAASRFVNPRRKLTWTAMDEKGLLITKVSETQARDLHIQLLWEFGA